MPSDRIAPVLCRRGQFARGDHLGQHHRGGLQRLDLFLDVSALGAVLHDKHAERVAGAQDRHAEERMVDFFAGFRAERERRMALCVGQIERRRLAGDEADEAFMRAQHRSMDGVAVQAFGGVEFERVVDAQHIGRADLGHHIGRDQHHDLVEALLRGDLFRHGFAEPSQQDAGTSRRAPHALISSPARPANRVARSWRHTRTNQQFYSFGAAANPRPRPNRIAKTVTQFAPAHLSGRIANQGSFCQAKRLPEVITSLWGRCCGS